jgi:hypothetical protein
MSYTKFDRHANMSKDTLREVGNIINEVFVDGSFNLTNMLYGLYDGYFYDELLSVAREELDYPLYIRVKKVVSIVKKYPKINR